MKPANESPGRAAMSLRERDRLGRGLDAGALAAGVALDDDVEGPARELGGARQPGDDRRVVGRDRHASPAP